MSSPHPFLDFCHLVSLIICKSPQNLLMFFVGLAVWSGAVCFPHSLGKHSWVSSNTEIFHPFFSCVSNVQWNCKVRGCTGVQYKGVKHLLIPWGTLLACIKCLERLDLLDSVWAPMLSFVAWLLKVLFKKQFSFELNYQHLCLPWENLKWVLSVWIQAVVLQGCDWLFLFSHSFAFALLFLLGAFYLKSVSSSWFFVCLGKSFRFVKGKMVQDLLGGKQRTLMISWDFFLNYLVHVWNSRLISPGELFVQVHLHRVTQIL